MTLNSISTNKQSNTIEILINSDNEIGGFQFNILEVNLTGASGGSADTANFNVATGPNGVLGFSLTGAAIPPTNGEELVLTTLSYDNPSGLSICSPLSELVISDVTGGSLNDYIVQYESACP